MLANIRCQCPTRREGVPGHFPDLMLDPEYVRVPRDARTHDETIRRAEAAPSMAAARRETDPLGVHPRHTALSVMPLFDQYAQVVDDTLHVLDGGVTMRHLLLFGNWVFKMGGRVYLSLVNKRLDALPRHDDFTHFSRPLFSEDKERKTPRAVKMTTNWRCTEYQELMSQMM